ncbi:hypothetical protein BSKO_04234 [Bryopsis sp. KO-2023]|nr:hypothetical protein BSKO_04234 [Bryopsis sp. KO-2023]
MGGNEESFPFVRRKSSRTKVMFPCWPAPGEGRSCEGNPFQGQVPVDNRARGLHEAKIVLPVLDLSKVRSTDGQEGTYAHHPLSHKLLHSDQSGGLPSSRRLGHRQSPGQPTPTSHLQQQYSSRNSGGSSYMSPPSTSHQSTATYTSTSAIPPPPNSARTLSSESHQLRRGPDSHRGKKVKEVQSSRRSSRIPQVSHLQSDGSSGSGQKPVVPSLNFAKHEGLGFGTHGGIDECKSARLPSGHPQNGTPRQTPLTARSQMALNPPNTARSSTGRTPSSSSSSSMFRSGPLTPAQVLRRYPEFLTNYEQSEILEYPQVYFIGKSAHKIKGNPHAGRERGDSDKGSKGHLNHGYDDERGDYMTVIHDHFGYRYEVLSVLGKGSFGQVLKCYDYKNHKLVAVKIIRNKKRFHHQALVEVKVLEMLKHRDSDDASNVVHMHEYFYFRSHLCIAFELMSINLYELIKQNNFQGLSLGLIRRFAVQILVALKFLKSLNIIHCDLKPENILLKQPDRSAVKVIDFGSSCLVDERLYTYIQSRFYRAPEVILGLPYGTPIDMWSLGCILAELYTGYPVFPGENEQEQLLCIMEVLGVPSRTMLEGSSRSKLFFDSSFRPRIVASSRGKKRHPGTKDLVMKLRCKDRSFLSFLEGCFRWEPRSRMTPEEALQHPWITEHVPPATHRSHQSSHHSSVQYHHGHPAQKYARWDGLSGASATSRPHYRTEQHANGALHSSRSQRTHQMGEHRRDANAGHQLPPIEGFLPRLLSLKQQ